MSVKISPFIPKSFKKTHKISGISISSIHCGLKKKNKHDLVLILFDKTSKIYGVFTKSQTPGEPVIWNKSIINYGKVSAILVNSGNANVFNGEKGKIAQKKIIQKLSTELSLKENEIYTASTGVIGEQLDHKKITK
ncbi:MAG: bifunctional ornithine acetyltransferase/N-acetylglutamate synthase, partial [Rickettsiales bacterium]|nr:bifunctional ornithine acetyltransferase/N-acetylglutamate synthase [Rickettsiales bacterium]